MLTHQLPTNKKIYFASDFHLGAPHAASSRVREHAILQWLKTIQHDAHIIFLLGDIFDFWYEYKRVVPKGFIRIQGKLAELSDQGIQLIFFTGNHDTWLFDYFPSEFNVTIYREPTAFTLGNHQFFIGHGDALGAHDTGYRWLKKNIFDNPFCHWIFERIHPNFGMYVAHRWSRSSRISKEKYGEKFQGEANEHLLTFCKETEKTTHHDYYIFGHRHLALDLTVNPSSRYINTGEWVHSPAYAVYDGVSTQLKTYPVV